MPRQISPKHIGFGALESVDAADGCSPVADYQSSSRSTLPRLNEKQLAERWGVSVRTLQAARIKGSGAPFIRIGRSVRYRLEDVLAYEKARLRHNTSDTL